MEINLKSKLHHNPNKLQIMSRLKCFCIPGILTFKIKKKRFRKVCIQPNYAPQQNSNAKPQLCMNIIQL